MRRRPSRMALLILCGTLAAHAGDKAEPAVGAAAPDFKSRNAVTHERIQLSEQTGKVVVLTFWATWCAPCRREIPILESLQTKVAKDQLIVFAVPFREPDQTYGALVRLFRSWKITLIDDRIGYIAGRYRINSIPHLFLIGRDGRIAAEHKGYGQGTLEELVADVNAALAPRPAAAPTDQPPAEH